MDFNDIRPYNDNEVVGAIQRIIDARKIEDLLRVFMSEIEAQQIINHLRKIKTVYEFQTEIIKSIVEALLFRTGAKIEEFQTENLNTDKSYLFISNHRDIVMDPTFLDIVLHKYGFETVEIAIGNNLLIEPWIEDLVRLNKSFIVRRDVQGRELLLASKKMSEYIRYAVTQKGSHVWIAQREGRAKDGNDKTQTSILKMLQLSGDKSKIVSNFNKLNILPVAISYEYDPCDVLKAKELYLSSIGEEYIKTPADDLLSMKYGLLGIRGKVAYSFGKQVLLEDEHNDSDINTITNIVADKIDSQIFSNMKLYQTHYIAYDKIHNSSRFANHYANEQVQLFDSIIDLKIKQLLPEFKDNQDFRRFVYVQYSNILENVLSD